MFGSLRAGFRKIDRALYPLWAAVVVLASARSFYGSLLAQTGGEWSAPLDDVFIHFDYARATALGHPFEWVPGNGYSSGNTSLSYPFVLAVGWLVGFREASLMVWAALVAAVSVFGLTLAVRPLFFARDADARGTHDDAGRLGSWLAPPFVVGVGALAWSLWSGMEVAFFVGVWALALRAYLRAEAAGTREPAEARRAFAWLGGAGALLVVTRPEASTFVALFAAFAAAHHLRRGPLALAGLLVRAGLPAGLLLAAQAVANRALTGESSANGAIVKLAVNNPFMTADEKLADYLFNLKYAFLRVVEYHFADHAGWGALLVFLALVPLATRPYRARAWLLWLQAVAWIALVALNGQVRWQNERYVMPAVTLVMLLAALGASTALRRASVPRPLPFVLAGAFVGEVLAVVLRPPGTMPEVVPWAMALGALGGVVLGAALRPQPLRLAILGVVVVLAHAHQVPKMRDQRWFFGRASRNIRDQHTTLGRWLKEQRPRRVLVGDAGAILYASERAGLDLIGLGGFHDLPFARAGLHGLPASLELIERLPEAQRPDVLAIFPTWWGVLPTWFGSEVLRRFPVEGNVICGGYEHVAYRADWEVLGTGNLPVSAEPGVAGPGRAREVLDEVDVADLVSEREHGYVFDRPANGWTDMRILPHPLSPRRDLWDGGRRIGAGRFERFRLGPGPSKAGAPAAAAGTSRALVFRTAPEGDVVLHLTLDGQPLPDVPIARFEGWVEVAVPVPDSAPSRFEIEVRPEGSSDFVDYHVWLVR